MSKLVGQDNIEIKVINGRNYRVFKNMNPIFYKENQPIPNYNENDDKFKDFENNDDVDSYSGDSNFLESSEEEDNEIENEENNKNKENEKENEKK
jgi:hypothetical protein